MPYDHVGTACGMNVMSIVVEYDVGCLLKYVVVFWSVVDVLVCGYDVVLYCMHVSGILWFEARVAQW